MIDYRLTEVQLRELCLAHRRAGNKREAYRTNAVILLRSGWTAQQVSRAPLIDPDTACGYFKRYRRGGSRLFRQAAFRGGTCWLTANELSVLDAHLQNHLYLSAKEIFRWVERAAAPRRLCLQKAQTGPRQGRPRGPGSVP